MRYKLHLLFTLPFYHLHLRKIRSELHWLMDVRMRALSGGLPPGCAPSWRPPHGTCLGPASASLWSCWKRLLGGGHLRHNLTWDVLSGVWGVNGPWKLFGRYSDFSNPKPQLCSMFYGNEERETVPPRKQENVGDFLQAKKEAVGVRGPEAADAASPVVPSFAPVPLPSAGHGCSRAAALTHMQPGQWWGPRGSP